MLKVLLSLSVSASAGMRIALCQPPEYQEEQEHPSIDSRWSSLASLKQQFPQS